MNTRRELQLELDANGAELENQAGFVPGPDPVLKKNFEIFFQKVQSATIGERLNGLPRLSLNARNVFLLAPFLSRTVLTW